MVDQEKNPFEKSVAPVDVVFDTVGGETLMRSWNVIKPGGQPVTVVSSEADPPEDCVKSGLTRASLSATRREAWPGQGGRLRCGMITQSVERKSNAEECISSF